MKVIKQIGLLVFVFGLIVSCKKDKPKLTDEMSIKDRYFNLEKVGWKSKSYTQKVDDIGFTATEVPIQYYLLKDQGIENLEQIDSLYEVNKRERVYEFVIAQEKEKDLMTEEYTGVDYTESLKYLSFAISKDFYVITSKKDTIRCDGTTIDQNYQIAPYKKILLYFSGIAPEEELQLIYNDKLFRKGLIKFKTQHNYTKIDL